MDREWRTSKPVAKERPRLMVFKDASCDVLQTRARFFMEKKNKNVAREVCQLKLNPGMWRNNFTFCS